MLTSCSIRCFILWRKEMTADEIGQMLCTVKSSKGMEVRLAAHFKFQFPRNVHRSVLLRISKQDGEFS